MTGNSEHWVIFTEIAQNENLKILKNWREKFTVKWKVSTSLCQNKKMYTVPSSFENIQVLLQNNKQKVYSVNYQFASNRFHVRPKNSMHDGFHWVSPQSKYTVENYIGIKSYTIIAKIRKLNLTNPQSKYTVK